MEVWRPRERKAFVGTWWWCWGEWEWEWVVEVREGEGDGEDVRLCLWGWSWSSVMAGRRPFPLVESEAMEDSIVTALSSASWRRDVRSCGP